MADFLKLASGIPQGISTGDILATSFGGTGVNAPTTSPTATSFAAWDANSNLSAKNHIAGYTTTATAAGTTTLTVGSNQQQYFTGSTTQTVTLPVTSTMVLGQTFTIVNNSSGVVTVQSSGGNTVKAMAASTVAVFTVILTSGTTAASWNFEYAAQSATGTGTVTSVDVSGGTTGLTTSGGPVTGSGTITLAGTLAIANGGSGQTTANTALNAFLPSQTGKAGKFLQTDATNTSWGSVTSELNTISDIAQSSNWTASNTGITVATTTTTSDLPLVGIFSTAIKITPVSGTDYVYYRFTMPSSLKNTRLKIQWNQHPLTGYVNGDLKVDIYQNSASNYSGSYTRFALSTDNSAVTSIPNYDGRFTTTFDADGSDYYELRIVRTAGTTALNIAGVIVGPGIQAQGGIIGPWIDGGVSTVYGASSNPTKGTVSYDKVRYRRMGDSMMIRWEFKGTTGGSEGSGAYILGIPGGYTLDTNSISNTATDLGAQTLGTFYARSTTPTIYTGAVQYYDAGGGKKGLVAEGIPEGSGSATQWSGSSIGVTGSTALSIFAVVPIAEWANSGIVNTTQNDVEYTYTTGTWDADSSTTGYGQGGVQIGGTLTGNRDKTVTWLSPIQNGDKIELELSEGGNQWYPAENFFASNGDGPIHTVFSAGGTRSGFLIRAVNSTQTTVRFYSKIQMNEDGSNTSNWTNTFYWRLKKSKAGVGIGFARATASVMGLAQMSDVIDITSKMTGSNSWSTTGATAVVFSNAAQTLWGMLLTFTGTNSGTATGVATVTISGIVYKTGLAQAFGGTNNASPFIAAMQAGGGTTDFFLATASGSPTNWRGSGFLLLDSKPTWA